MEKCDKCKKKFTTKHRHENVVYLSTIQYFFCDKHYREVCIARRSREYRKVHPYAESPKAAERGIEYAFSTREWAARSGNDALPNTYIEARD